MASNEEHFERAREIMRETEIGHGPCERCGEHKADVCRIGRGEDQADLCAECYRERRAERRFC